MLYPDFIKRLFQYGDENYLAKIILFSHYNFNDLSDNYDISYKSKNDKAFKLVLEVLVSRFKSNNPDTNILGYLISKISLQIENYKGKITKPKDIDFLNGNVYYGWKCYELLLTLLKYYIDINMNVFRAIISYIKLNPNINETFILNIIYNDKVMYRHDVISALINVPNVSVYTFLDLMDIYFKKSYFKIFDISPYVEKMFSFHGTKLNFFKFLSLNAHSESFNLYLYSKKVERSFIFTFYSFIHLEAKKVFINFLDDAIYQYSKEGNFGTAENYKKYQEWFINTYEKDKNKNFEKNGYEEPQEIIDLIIDDLQYCNLTFKFIYKSITFDLESQILTYYILNRLYLFTGIQDNFNFLNRLKNNILSFSIDFDPLISIENGNIYKMLNKIL